MVREIQLTHGQIAFVDEDGKFAVLNFPEEHVNG